MIFMKKLDQRYFIRGVFMVAVLVYIITAVFSIGYHHADEHYQIIEFALYKLGINQAEQLAWEFEMQIRPGLQPFIAFSAIKILNGAGITAPFTQAAVIRICMGMFALLAIFAGVKALLQYIHEPKFQKALIILSPFLWFIPYISVRFSSETFAGSLFLLGFAWALLRSGNNGFLWMKKIPWWLIGLVLMLSVAGRFTSVLMIGGLLAWLLFIQRIGLRPVIQILLGMLGGVLIMGLLDRWLYGEWCSPLLNAATLLFQGSGPNFGRQAWWFLISEVFFKGGFFIGFCMIFCLLYLLIRAHTHPVVWVIVPLLIFHLLISHKELRFLFPLAFFMPFVIVYVAADLLLFIKKTKHILLNKILPVFLCSVFCIVNIVLCSVVTHKPADPDTATIQYILKNYHPERVVILHNLFGNPFDPFYAFPVAKHFYLPAGMEIHHLDYPKEAEKFIRNNNKTVLLCIRKHTDNFDVLKESGFSPVYKSPPDFYFDLGGERWENKENALELYQYKVCRTGY
jgi:GPI mannosyltransferase 3